MEDYASSDTTVWSGIVVGSESPDDCGTGGEASGARECSFILRGVSPGTVLELDLWETEMEGIAGTLTTQSEQCGARVFDGAELRVNDPLSHDALSQLTFPGNGRLMNTIYAVRPTTGPFAGRDVMAIVSLLRDERVEVRLMAGEGRRCAPGDCDAFARGECDLFAVFRLRRGAR